MDFTLNTISLVNILTAFEIFATKRICHSRADEISFGIQSTLVITDTFELSFVSGIQRESVIPGDIFSQTSINGDLNFVRNSGVCARRELTVFTSLIRNGVNLNHMVS